VEEFEHALTEWRNAAFRLSVLDSAFDIAYAKALATADGKNEAARKAQADLATKEEREKRDSARIEERSAFYRMRFIMARAGVQEAA
jgi:hypothetical protein